MILGALSRPDANLSSILHRLNFGLSGFTDAFEGCSPMVTSITETGAGASAVVVGFYALGLARLLPLETVAIPSNNAPSFGNSNVLSSVKFDRIRCQRDGAIAVAGKIGGGVVLECGQALTGIACNVASVSSFSCWALSVLVAIKRGAHMAISSVPIVALVLVVKV